MNNPKLNLMGRLAMFFVVSLGLGFTAKPQTPRLWGNIAPGKYRAGFKLINLRDKSRTFLEIDEKTAKTNIVSRPVAISVWYPADASGKQQPMPFAEYVYDYVSTDAELYKGLNDADKVSVKNIYREQNFKNDSEAKFNELLKTSTGSFKNPAPLKGKFPVIVYAPGAGGTPFTHTPICEFLASHGFVVVSTGSRGVDSTGMTLDAAGVEAQTRDLEFMLAAASDFPNADSGKIGAVGFSLGGAAVLALAMRNPLIKAVVSLDGSIGFAPYADMQRRFEQFVPTNFRVPLLSVNKIDYEYNDSSVFDSLKYSNRYSLGFTGIEHHDLIASKNISGVVRGTVDKRAGAVFKTSCEYLLNFLNATIKDDKKAEKYLAALPANSAEFNDFAVTKRFAALALPPTEAEFIRLFRSPTELEKTFELYRKAKSQNPQVHFWREAALENVGLDLLDGSQTAAAIEIFKVNAAKFPISERALNALADAYSEYGDKQSAREFYEKVLAINPRNRQANLGLKKLGGEAK